LAPEALKQGGKMPENFKTNYIDYIGNAVKDLKKAETDFRQAAGWEVDKRG
jgi:hypothetical protein